MCYILNTAHAISVPSKADNPAVEELLSNYTYGKKWNTVYNSEENCITIGNYTKADCRNSEYVINVTDEGV